MLPSTFVRRVLRDAVQRHVAVAGIDDNFRKYGSVKKSTRKAAPRGQRARGGIGGARFASRPCFFWERGRFLFGRLVQHLALASASPMMRSISLCSIHSSSPASTAWRFSSSTP